VGVTGGLGCCIMMRFDTSSGCVLVPWEVGGLWMRTRSEWGVSARRADRVVEQ
jgi:hypothetical protein